MPVLNRFSKPAFTKEDSVKTCSVVSQPNMKPACSIGSIWPIVGPMRKNIIRSIGLYRQLSEEMSL